MHHQIASLLLKESRLFLLSLLVPASESVSFVLECLRKGGESSLVHLKESLSSQLGVLNRLDESAHVYLSVSRCWPVSFIDSSLLLASMVFDYLSLHLWGQSLQELRVDSIQVLLRCWLFLSCLLYGRLWFNRLYRRNDVLLEVFCQTHEHIRIDFVFDQHLP